MMTRCFDSYLIVDWSAASTPKRGADSIWWALHRAGEGLVARGNPTTRAEAREIIGHLLRTEADLGRKLLAGFDFPFGYPRGTAEIIAGKPDTLAVWAWLAERIEDAPDNANNRFEIAAQLNALFDGTGPFWGRPGSLDIPAVPEKGRAVAGAHPPVRRLVEERVPSAQVTWKLFTTGSVGSQVLMGLPVLAALRNDPALAGRLEVWPFDTGLAPPRAPVCLAEIYPSLLPVTPQQGEVKDAAQVRETAAAFAKADARGELAAMFAGTEGLSARERKVIEREEAWILGVGHEAALRT